MSESVCPSHLPPACMSVDLPLRFGNCFGLGFGGTEGGIRRVDQGGIVEHRTNMFCSLLFYDLA